MRHKYHHFKHKGPRVTARGVVMHEGKILLIERWRDGLHYFSIPGGGVDKDESFEQAAKREVKEESTLEVEPERLLYDITDTQDGHRHYIFLCRYISGEPSLPHDSEEAHAGPDNRFAPLWLPLEQLESVPFMYWEHARDLLVADLRRGFAKDVKITSF